MGLLGRRRPLLRGAVVGGTAYYVGKKRAQNQAAEESAEEDQNRRIDELQGEKQGSAQQTTETDEMDKSMQKIKKLQTMHDSGVLTDEEFSQAKEKILSQM
jgi:hypothetical protein